MFTLFHRIRKQEEGQTLVLGAVSMLVLALCVMATVNIGQATYEKVKLQNTADATAYSMAATQAAGFNFFAYTNRAMLCHYAGMMAFLSWLSFIQYLKNTWGRLFDVLQFIPYIGIVFKILKKIIDIAYKIVDKLVEFVIPALGIFNYIYFAFQVAMWLFLESQLITNPDVLHKNDPDVSLTSPLGIVAKGMNAIMLNKMIDYKSIMKLLEKSKKINGNEGRKVMADMINSGRHWWTVGTDQDFPLLGRIFWWKKSLSIFGLVTLKFEIRKSARTEHGMMADGLAKKYDQLYAVDALKVYAEFDVAGYHMHLGFSYLSEVWADSKKGDHREMLVDVHGRPWGRTFTDCHAKGIFKVFPAPCSAYNAAATPLNDGPWTIFVEALKLWAAEEEQTGKHHTYFGATPFVKFRPEAKWRAAFDQPDYLIVANKPNDKLNGLSFEKKFSMDNHVSGRRIKTKEGTDHLVDFTHRGNVLSFLAKGDSAIAVSRAYYHRPGDWREHPNFFNPFWGAKLEAVAHHQLFDSMHLGTIADQVITH